MKKPIIGVTPLYDAPRSSLWMLPGYMQGLESAGAIPVMLPLTADPSELEPLARICSGFLFTGGQDVSPALYGEAPSSACGEICPARDNCEKVLLDLALELDKPILGICRGIQFLNAALGGTLYQDLPSEHPSQVRHRMLPPYDRPCHTVSVLPGTPLAELLEVSQLPVNSYHHQAIRRLAPGLLKMAESPDGLTEAVFMPGKRFAWAVQWHPEFSFRTDEASRRIFGAFVSAAAGETVISPHTQGTLPRSHR